MVWEPFDFRKALWQRASLEIDRVLRRAGLLPAKGFFDLDELETPAYSLLKDTVGYVWEAWHNELAPEDEKNSRASYPLIDTIDFKSEMPAIAKRYLGTPASQTPFFTNVICAGLLDSELYPLKREIAAPETFFFRYGAGSFVAAFFEASGAKSATAGAAAVKSGQDPPMRSRNRQAQSMASGRAKCLTQRVAT